VFSVALAAIAGNITGYYTGKFFGHRLLKKKDTLFFKQRHLEQSKAYYNKYGGNVTLIIARFLPVIRTFAPILAGAIKVDFFKFMIFNIIGALAWIVSLSAIGYFLVQLFPKITDHMGYIFIALIILTALPILKIIFKKKTEEEV
jgi:membrane-associated protein